MTRYGYGGRILRVDLGDRSFKVEQSNITWFKSVIGGRAANTKRLYEELNTECDPLGPENIIIYGVGPLTGSLLPASAYYTVTAKSPMTGILGDSAAGGQFAAEMKLTGFDQIIITGESERPTYLMVTNDGVEFVECPELAGKNIVETTTAIRKLWAVKENLSQVFQCRAGDPDGELPSFYAATSPPQELIGFYL
ncbi:MAG: aldehyde ferredoxin oxidoreductase, partial [Candidatus Thorarchaeota archaeon]